MEKKEVKKEVVKKRELAPEPKRYGNSGNWYEVQVECARCETLLDQKFGIEESLVMREFFDYIQIDSNKKGGKFVFPSIVRTERSASPIRASGSSSGSTPWTSGLA